MRLCYQLTPIVHKNVLINGNVVNTPSYIVPVNEENSITLKVKAKKPKAEAAPVAEAPTEVTN